MVFLSSNQSAIYQRRRKKHAKSSRKVARKHTFENTYKPNTIPLREGSDHSKIPSCDNIDSGLCSRKENPKYTGNLVKGISTLHKSNAVPVISEEEMISHANMRR